MLMLVMGKVADAQEAAPSCSESFSLLPKLPLDWQNLFFPLFNFLPIFFLATHIELVIIKILHTNFWMKEAIFQIG